jgi:acetylornithine deacetylase
MPDQDMTEPLQFLRSLIARGRAGERAVQEAVGDRLQRLGCAVETLDYDPAEVVLRHEFAESVAMTPGRRTAIVGTLKGEGRGRSVILFAHPDSEPVADADRWTVDPFAGEIRDGRIHGWGVADDLSGVAAMVCGLEAALGDGWRPQGDIVIASTPSKRHARGVAAVLDRLPTPDAAIYLHPAESGAGMAEIKACTPGLLEFRINWGGLPPDTKEIGHSAFAHRALNPSALLPLLLGALRSLDAERGDRLRHGRIEGFVGRATNILVSHVAVGRPASRNRAPIDGLIEGSISLPPGEALEGAMAELTASLAGASIPTDWPEASRPRLTFPAGVAGAETPADHPLFATAETAVRAETGRAAFVNPVHTASDIRVPLVQKGIPTVGLGPLGGNLTQNGGVDEWVDVEDHGRCVRVVAAALRGWCG